MTVTNEQHKWNVEKIYDSVGNLWPFQGQLYVDQIGYIRIDSRWFWQRMGGPLGDYSKEKIIKVVMDTLNNIHAKMNNFQYEDAFTIMPKSRGVSNIDFVNAILNREYYKLGGLEGERQYFAFCEIANKIKNYNDPSRRQMSEYIG